MIGSCAILHKLNLLGVSRQSDDIVFTIHRPSTENPVIIRDINTYRNYSTPHGPFHFSVLTRKYLSYTVFLLPIRNIIATPNIQDVIELTISLHVEASLLIASILSSADTRRD